MNTPVIVVVMETNSKMARKWEKIKENMERYIGIIEIFATDDLFVDNTIYPKDLQRYIRWTPTAIIFMKDNWDTACEEDDGEIKLYGSVFNGRVVDSDIMFCPRKDGKIYSSGVLLDWAINHPFYLLTRYESRKRKIKLEEPTIKALRSDESMTTSDSDESFELNEFPV